MVIHSQFSFSQEKITYMTNTALFMLTKNRKQSSCSFLSKERNRAIFNNATLVRIQKKCST